MISSLITAFFCSVLNIAGHHHGLHSGEVSEYLATRSIQRIQGLLPEEPEPGQIDLKGGYGNLNILFLPIYLWYIK